MLDFDLEEFPKCRKTDVIGDLVQMIFESRRRTGTPSAVERSAERVDSLSVIEWKRLFWAVARHEMEAPWELEPCAE